MHRMTFLRQLAGNHRAAESGTDAEVGFHRASLKFQALGFKKEGIFEIGDL
jgi:hypothetical protein